MIGKLAATGLKILDIGLESASPTQLLKMNKTKRPEAYLEKALKILEECKKYGVWVKLNILLFAGETYETIAETVSWLQKHKHLIKGVAVSSLVYYKGSGALDELLEQGAKVPLGYDVNDYGFVDLDLSDEIDNKATKKLSLDIFRLMMTQKDYYDIKSVSYFERGYTYAQFENDVACCEHPEKLPFEIAF